MYWRRTGRFSILIALDSEIIFGSPRARGLLALAALARSLRKLVEIISLVRSHGRTSVTATEQEPTNTAAHSVAGTYESDLGGLNFSIFLFRNKKIILSTS